MKNKFSIILCLVILVITTINKLNAYCFYNQTGSDAGPIEVYVYGDQAGAIFGSGFSQGSAAIDKTNNLTGGAIPFYGSIGKVIGLIGSATHIAHHTLNPGEKACWNWQEIKNKYHKENLWFVVVTPDSVINKGIGVLWVNSLSTHDGLVFCMKGDLALVQSNHTDPRCGNNP